MDLKERLLLFIDSLSIEKARFEKEVGLSNGFVDKVNNNIRKSSLNRISNRYPHLNIDWLLTGNGVMLLGTEELINSDGSINEEKTVNFMIENLRKESDLLVKVEKRLEYQDDLIKHFLKENNELKEEKKELKGEIESLRKENKRLDKLNAYYRGLLDTNGIDHKQTAS